MGVYLGYINEVSQGSGIFYNFKPLARIEENGLNVLNDEERARLLPDSQHQDICFDYKLDQLDIIKKHFCEGSLVIFEFESNDLKESWNYNTQSLNPTGYRLDKKTVDFIREKKICFIDRHEFIRIVDKYHLKGFPSDEKVYIMNVGVLPGEKIFVNDGEGFFAGPYEVNKPDAQGIYIQTKIRDNKYILNGYEEKTFDVITLSDEWNGFSAKICNLKNAAPVQKDFITEMNLLESFQNLWKQGEIIDIISKENIDKLVNRYENSVLAGLKSEEIRKKRLDILENILTNENELDYTLNNVASIFFAMLSKCKDKPEVKEWVENLFDNNPNLVKETLTQFANIQNDFENFTEESSGAESKILEIKSEELEHAKNEIANLEREKQDWQSKYEKLQAEMAEIENLDKKRSEVDILKDTIKSARNNFDEFLKEKGKAMADFVLDDFMADRMMNAAAEWGNKKNYGEYEGLVQKVSKVPVVEKNPEELKEYICRMVKSVRPDYDDNCIMNIAICLTQGFLTVFYGKPGGGKTSICNIFADVLGLNKIGEKINSNISAGRYIPISVEKGWTSKRDFLGYYNPLSKTFDSGNRKIFEALNILDLEKKEHIARMPFFVLLDEANLSSPEYYWSEFMNLCDGLNENSFVNLGENYIFSVPETLRFVATINNDHTTEVLSPRLIDRAWIISLPEKYSFDYERKQLPKNEIEIISWDSLKNSFIPENSEYLSLRDLQNIYDELQKSLKEQNFFISPRVDIAVRRYVVTAKKFLDNKYDALDYAIAQKILPQIKGEGDLFRKWLEGSMKKIFDTYGLSNSVSIIQNMIKRGESTYYYDFFF